MHQVGEPWGEGGELPIDQGLQLASLIEDQIFRLIVSMAEHDLDENAFAGIQPSLDRGGDAIPQGVAKTLAEGGGRDREPAQKIGRVECRGLGSPDSTLYGLLMRTGSLPQKTRTLAESRLSGFAPLASGPP
jgi:hypothetical protein